MQTLRQKVHGYLRMNLDNSDKGKFKILMAPFFK